jgi:hypothetical protein
MPTDPTRASLAPCDVSGRRGGFPTLLLAIATLWLVAVAMLLAREPEMRHGAVPFVSIGALMALAAYGSQALTASWDQIGRFALWFGFGLSLSIWMIGIFSIGWLVFPALFLQLIALIAWPRDEEHPIVDRHAIGAEVLGFLCGPAILGLSFFAALPVA